MNGNKARSASIDVHRWRLCRSRKEAVNIVIPAKAGPREIGEPVSSVIKCFGDSGSSPEWLEEVLSKGLEEQTRWRQPFQSLQSFRAEREKHLREKTYDE